MQYFAPEERSLIRLLQRSGEGFSMKELVVRCQSGDIFAIGEGATDALRKKIERCIKSLQDKRVPVLEGDERPKRYFIDADYKPPFELDLPTAISVVIAKSQLDQVFPASLASEMDVYFDRARDFLQKNGAASYGKLLTKIAFYPEGYGARLLSVNDTSAKVYHQVLDALLREKKLKFHYFNRYGDKHGVRIESPYGLVLRNGVAYLVVKSAQANHFKHLNLSRIQGTPEVLEDAAAIDSTFNLKTYIDAGAFLQDNYEVRDKEHVVLEVTKNLLSLLQERMDGKIKVLEFEDAGRPVVSFSERLYPEFLWWILGFGQQVIVREPEWLRLLVIETLQQMMRNYQQGS